MKRTVRRKFQIRDLTKYLPDKSINISEKIKCSKNDRLEKSNKMYL